MFPRFRRLSTITSFGFVVFLGYFTHSVIQSKQKDNDLQLLELKKNEKKTSNNHKNEINHLLERIEQKSFREKIDSAYDGAVKTHNIGFPSSSSFDSTTTVRGDK